MNTKRLDAKNLHLLAKGKEHNDGGGLGLQITPKGSMCWKFKFTYGGKAEKMGLGGIGARSIHEARELAAKYGRLVRDGHDPATTAPTASPAMAAPRRCSRTLPKWCATPPARA
ncbi:MULTISPECIES: Arm DNA-binding domain-containing protein [unclassified Bradyrhizobium]|uniref:Arm DNA-binding domain-containing protein n=1 Tax=unclassified Bradyrhizobium TaxID=2631580 RepID=UPI00247AF4B6|nr:MULTISPECIES: Arm DNA-binding domain-containing protein [unclassified Bradyrhizobium]WGR72671.1 Arm DNA-binding domain-containing protein [Bradyrhizobium sp. ISRA426]WGR77504.1 Arm DNA-binding domain-containing protein [Bradyrhizobium sp. ISRA430]WGR87910.1 Arm DNA-binding domain-containing protein [Bradyrhizobium sp. ISRA432]